MFLAAGVFAALAALFAWQLSLLIDEVSTPTVPDCHSIEKLQPPAGTALEARGYAWKCGLVQVKNPAVANDPPGLDRLKVFAYIAPTGLWCWSNAGLVVEPDQLTAIDALTDDRRTQSMLDAYEQALGGRGTKHSGSGRDAGASVQATLLFTHNDIDHIFGASLLRRWLGTFAGGAGASSAGNRNHTASAVPPADKVKTVASKTCAAKIALTGPPSEMGGRILGVRKMALARVGWWLLSAQDPRNPLRRRLRWPVRWALAGLQRLGSWLGSDRVRAKVISVLGAPASADFFWPFDFAASEGALFPIDETLEDPASAELEEAETGPGRRTKGFSNTIHAGLTMHHVAGAHSAADSFVYLPSEKICFAGDLLFVGVSPIMWAGPAASFLEALGTMKSAVAEETLFVPGHGPLTDMRAVDASIQYWEYVQRAAKECSVDGLAREACGRKAELELPSPWREWNGAERIRINVFVEMGHLDAAGAGETFTVSPEMKMQLILFGQGRAAVERDLREAEGGA